MTKVTLRVHELPEYAGGAILSVRASSDDAFRRLLRYFVGYYREKLFNGHWGEQAHIGSDNVLRVSMVSLGLSTEEARKVWQPFLNWVARSAGMCAVGPGMILGSMPARHWWDVEWRKDHHQHVFDSDTRSGTSKNNVWWTGGWRRHVLCRVCVSRRERLWPLFIRVGPWRRSKRPRHSEGRRC